jgi:hypothetical protein
MINPNGASSGAALVPEHADTTANRVPGLSFSLLAVQPLERRLL